MKGFVNHVITSFEEVKKELAEDLKVKKELAKLEQIEREFDEILEDKC